MTTNNQNYDTPKSTTHTDSFGFCIITTYNANKQKIKETHYKPNGTIGFIEEHNPITGNISKLTSYHPNGAVQIITHYDPITNHETKYITYRTDGAIQSIVNYDPNSGKKINSIYYNSNNSLNYINEHDPQTHNLAKTTWYNPDGFLYCIEKFNPKTPWEERICTLYFSQTTPAEKQHAQKIQHSAFQEYQTTLQEQQLALQLYQSLKPTKTHITHTRSGNQHNK